MEINKNTITMFVYSLFIYSIDISALELLSDIAVFTDVHIWSKTKKSSLGTLNVKFKFSSFACSVNPPHLQKLLLQLLAILIIEDDTRAVGHVEFVCHVVTQLVRVVFTSQHQFILVVYPYAVNWLYLSEVYDTVVKWCRKPKHVHLGNDDVLGRKTCGLCRYDDKGRQRYVS